MVTHDVIPSRPRPTSQLTLVVTNFTSVPTYLFSTGTGSISELLQLLLGAKLDGSASRTHADGLKYAVTVMVMDVGGLSTCKIIKSTYRGIKLQRSSVRRKYM